MGFLLSNIVSCSYLAGEDTSSVSLKADTFYPKASVRTEMGTGCDPLPEMLEEKWLSFQEFPPCIHMCNRLSEGNSKIYLFPMYLTHVAWKPSFTALVVFF